MPRRRKRVPPSRETILTAAEAVYAERGYAATPLRDLIKASGCSTTAFYARFDSKESVFEALLVELIAELQQALATAVSHATSVESGFDLGVEAFLAVVEPRKGLVGVVLSEATSSTRTREVLHRSYDVLVRLLSEELEAIVRRGQSVRQEPRTVAWAIVGALTMQLTRWAVFDEIPDDELETALRSTADAMAGLISAPSA